jgi:hypothetical protein
MFKALIIRIFLKKEAEALRSRLAEASAALDKIEKTVTSISTDAAAETHELAERVLTHVLSSADKLRTKETVIVHAWEQKLYSAYGDAKKYAESTYNLAVQYITASLPFFKK